MNVEHCAGDTTDADEAQAEVTANQNWINDNNCSTN
jgi:hypothetical protein